MSLMGAVPAQTKDGAEVKSSASFDLKGKTVELPVYSGTTGPDVVDISKFYAQTGCFTYDPGFTSTGSCESAITYIDGEQGILLHRGYPIQELAEHSDFMEVCYLLLEGELPTPEQKAKFRRAWVAFFTYVYGWNPENSDVTAFTQVPDQDTPAK